MSHLFIFKIYKKYIGDINWDCVESIFNYGLQNMMNMNPTDYPIMLAENYFNDLQKKEKVIIILTNLIANLLTIIHLIFVFSY